MTVPKAGAEVDGTAREGKDPCVPVPLAPVVGVILVAGFVGGFIAHRCSDADKERRLDELAGQRVTLGVAAHDGRVTFVAEVDVVIAGVDEGRLLLSKVIDSGPYAGTWFVPNDADIIRDGLTLHRVRWVETPDGRRYRW